MTTDGIDPQRWRTLSPHLDALLELPADERPDRLDALRRQDPGLADDLAHLLERFEGLARTDFLAEPALAPPSGAAGQRVGAYTLERELGRGGMGTVWLARRTDGRYDGQVAIKFLQSTLFGPVAGERFAREGRILARLDHPHIARLIDAGHLGAEGPGPAQPYLVLEYVDGEPIDEHCQRQGMETEARLRLFIDVLAAVAHAHNRLILHRDIKPSNILVTAAGQVKLLDFGIAKLLDADGGELTQRAGPAFTPLYAAPEQLQGGDVTTATDVYALGVLLYRLLGGRHPTADATTGGPLHQWQSVVEAVPPKVSEAALKAGDRRLARLLRGDLDTIVAKALKKAPAERYANAADLADDLRRCLGHEPIAARPDSAAYRAGKFLRRHRVGVAATAATTLALAGAAFVAWHEARAAQQQRAQAERLIEFMLGDLPGKLKPVGRLDALDAVGEQALAYYAAQQAGTLDAASLGRRARALHLIGEIDDQRGRLTEAARRFDEAAAATAELMARHPGVPEHLFNHAQSEYWIGFIERRRGRSSEAEAAFLRYRGLADKLAALEPANPKWRIEQAYAGQNLGVLQLEAGRPAAALQAFERTLQAWRQVVGERPEMAFDLANTLGWIAVAHEAANAWQQALEAQRAKREALARVPDAARDREAQYLRANVDHQVSRLHLALGQTEAAVDSGRRAVAQWQALVAQDPANLDWIAQTAFSHLGLADALPDAQARVQLAAAQALVAQLMAQPERRMRWRINLQGRLLLLQGRLAAGDPAPVRSGLAAWLDTLRAEEAAGRPPDAEQARIAAQAGLLLGELLQRAGRSAEAAAAWDEAARRLRPGVQRQEQPALALDGLLALRRGDPQTARRHADRLRQSPYRHPDVAALVQALP